MDSGHCPARRSSIALAPAPTKVNYVDTPVFAVTLPGPEDAFERDRVAPVAKGCCRSPRTASGFVRSDEDPASRDQAVSGRAAATDQVGTRDGLGDRPSRRRSSFWPGRSIVLSITLATRMAAATVTRIATFGLIPRLSRTLMRRYPA